MGWPMTLQVRGPFFPTVRPNHPVKPACPKDTELALWGGSKDKRPSMEASGDEKLVDIFLGV